MPGERDMARRMGWKSRRFRLLAALLAAGTQIQRRNLAARSVGRGEVWAALRLGLPIRRDVILPLVATGIHRPAYGRFRGDIVPVN